LPEQIRNTSNETGARLMALEIPERIFRIEFNPSFPFGVISGQEDYAIVTPIDVFQSNKGKLHYREKSHGHFTLPGCRLVDELLAEKIITQTLLTDSK